jgi:two-component system sensor histidine kinase PilS (NtrC family)
MSTGLSLSSAFDERSWLAWLVKVRLIVITLLVAVELAITRLTPTTTPEWAFASIVLLWYALAAFFVLLLSFWKEYRLQSMLQVVTDVTMATALVYITGGIDSSFNFLYALIIVVASILLPRSFAYVTSLLSFVLYGLVVELAYFEVIPAFSPVKVTPKALQAIMMVNLFAYLAIAYLAGHLSNRLRQVDVQLQDTSGLLENLQALHENVIRSMKGGLLTTDREGRITLANPASEQLLEQTERELLGRSIAQLFLDRLPDLRSTPAHREVRCRTTTGEIKTFAVTVTPLTGGGEGSFGWIYTFDDLTEIRRLEREVQLRDRLAAVGRMAGAIAHEIRNPLSSIAGSVSVLSGISELTDEQRLLVQIVMRESERLNGIISDFLAYAREKQYQFAKRDIIPLLEDTLTLLENEPRASTPIRIVRRFEVRQAVSLIDGDKLKQVFWNICSNAVRAMPMGGTLTVSVQPADGDWLIGFTDSGRGLESHQVEKIFEPFQSHFEGGTGLGLAIVYQIMQAHEGGVSVSSVPGQGTVFTVSLRRATTARELPSVKNEQEISSPLAASAVAAGGTQTHG